MADERFRNTGNHAKPIRPNHAISELMWEDGECFKLVPREVDRIRTAELVTMSEDGDETFLMLGADSLRIIHKELGRLLAWVEEES